jgi:O-antigen/teichoic acid export membrane protein
MSNNQRFYVYNAVCNIFPIISQILIILVLTPVLVNKLDSDSFAIWSLVQQAGALVISILSVFQVVLSKNVARLHATGEIENLSKYLRGVAPLVGRLIVLVVVFSVILAILLPFFLSNISSQSRPVFGAAIFIYGCAISLNSLTVFLSGYLQGVSRNLYSSLLQVGSKVVLAYGWILVAKTSGKVMPMMFVSLAVAAVTSRIAIIPFSCHSIYLKSIFGNVNKELSKATLSETMYLLVWAVSMMFVSGLSIFLVAKFDYGEIKTYSVAFTCVGGVNAIFGAASSVFVPMCSTIAVRHSPKVFGDFVTNLTAVHTSVMIIISIPLLFYGNSILSIWIGTQVSEKQRMILICLTVANLIRNSASPYAYGIIATGAQKDMLTTPVLEGFLTFIASVCLGSYYGVMGVVAGMVIGSVICVVLHVVINFRRISVLILDWESYFKSGLLYPLGILGPFVFVQMSPSSNKIFNTVGLIVGLVAAFLSLLHLFRQLSCLNMKLKMGSH